MTIFNSQKFWWRQPEKSNVRINITQQNFMIFFLGGGIIFWATNDQTKQRLLALTGSDSPAGRVCGKPLLEKNGNKTKAEGSHCPTCVHPYITCGEKAGFPGFQGEEPFGMCREPQFVAAGYYTITHSSMKQSSSDCHMVSNLYINTTFSSTKTPEYSSRIG